MTIKDKRVLVTGANRGIGRALVAEALARGARRVYQQRRHRPARRPDRPHRARTPPGRQPLRDLCRDPGLPAVGDPFPRRHRQHPVGELPGPVAARAAFSLTQSLRALLAGQEVKVHAVLPGPVDTDMTRGSDIPKASPESVALAIFNAIDNGEEDIFPDPASAPMAGNWRNSPAKTLERQLAQPAPVSS